MKVTILVVLSFVAIVGACASIPWMVIACADDVSSDGATITYEGVLEDIEVGGVDDNNNTYFNVDFEDGRTVILFSGNRHECCGCFVRGELLRLEMGGSGRLIDWEQVV